MRKKLKKAFTLIELMVVIAIIALLATGLSSLNFSMISDRQKAEDLANQIITEIEIARDGMMTGKGLYNKETRKLLRNIVNTYLDFRVEGESKEKNRLKLIKRYNVGFGQFFSSNGIDLGVPMAIDLKSNNTMLNKIEEKNLGKGYINNIYCGKDFNKKLEIKGGDERNNSMYNFLPLFSFNFGDNSFTTGIYTESFITFYAATNEYPPEPNTRSCSTPSDFDKEIVIIVGYNKQFSGIRFNRISGVVEKVPNNQIDKDGNFRP